ncbi:MAG: carbohydrate kinase [Actinomycetales bacterium]|nr:MAG: carbohydrate kinase [Actinomycetales bacterium]
MKWIQSEQRDLLRRPVVPKNNSTLILGVDIGSSGLKAVLLDVEKGICATVSESLALYNEHTGWAEADTDEWWQSLCIAIPKLIAKANCKSTDISAVAISGMVPAVVISDENGQVLRRAILQNDARATSEISELSSKLEGLDLLSLTGSLLTQQSVAPTALWLSRNESEIWRRAKLISGSYDWIAMRLGAKPHVERNWAIESGLYGWDKQPISEVISATNISWPELLTPLDPGTPVGEVSKAAAIETGLQAGIAIYVGGADHVLSAYGAGLNSHGDCLVKLGGAGDILAVSDEFFIDPRLYLDAHPIPGKWLPNGCMATSGSLLRWEQKILNGVDLETLDNEAQNSEAGALLTLPYFLGEKSPLHDPNLRGVISGLHLGTTRGDIHRSFLEAIAYGFKEHFQIFAERGLIVKSPKVTNGGSKSRLWREILADVLDKNLTSIINHPGASFGAAVIAGIGSGAISDWSYVDGALEKGEIIEPNGSNKARYQERYGMYLELQTSTREISHKLARTN